MWIKDVFISDCSENGKDNNLNIVRLLAASLVTVLHAYPLTGGGGDWLERLTGLVSFGALAVLSFFIISGFLIAQSYDRSKQISFFCGQER